MRTDRALWEHLQRFWLDEDVQALVQTVREAIVTEWSQATTKEKREECHAELRALDKLKKKFAVACNGADVAGLEDQRNRTRESGSTRSTA